MDTESLFLDFFGIERSDSARKQLSLACRFWRFGEKDLLQAIYNARKGHRTDLPSVRKLLGVYIREWMGVFDDRYRKRLYFNVPGTVTYMAYIRERLAGTAYVGTPDMIQMTVLYGLFGREEKIEVGNCHHCAANMLRLSLGSRSDFPKPDVRLSFGFTCDEALLVDALLADHEPDAVHVRITNPNRFQDDTAYLTQRMREGLKRVQAGLHLPSVTEEEESALYLDCKSFRFRMAFYIDQILRKIGESGKFLLTNNDLVFLETLLLTSFQTEPAELESMLQELLEDLERAEGEALRYRFCIYYTPICNPVYGNVMQKYGIALLHQTAFMSTAIITGEADPVADAVLEGVGMSVSGSALREGKRIANLIRQRGLDGFVTGMFGFDRWMGPHQELLGKIIEEETGKPVFSYDADFWNQEPFSADRMESSVETFLALLERR